MITYPNQKIVEVNKPSYTQNFLTIGSEEWIDACNNLTYSTFKIYLYLANNANGFKMALSPKAIMKKIKISENTYRNAVKELIEQGYLTNIHSNMFSFTTYPQWRSIDQAESGISTSTMVETPPIECDITSKCSGREINKINKDNKINNNTNKKDKEIPSSEEDEYVKLFDSVGIKFNKCTKDNIEKIIEEEVDLRVIRRVIYDNRKTFEKNKTKGSSYLFAILKNLISEKYQQTKRKLEVEDIERERMINERREKKDKIDYSAISEHSRRNREKEKGEDILQIMEEIWG